MVLQKIPDNIPDPRTMQSLREVTCGKDVKLMRFINLYGCTLEDDVFVGPFVEIQAGVRIGARSRIQSHTFICEGVTVEEEVFIGHGVMFINDLHPRAANPDGTRQTSKDWILSPIVVKRRASIGSGAVILGGITIGEGAMIGAGAVVTKDVPADTILRGEPARILRLIESH